MCPALASGFDLELLRQRGIHPDMAAYFAESPRFTPGLHEVRLEVNGQALGLAQLRFDDDGALCFDHALLAAARLTPPAQATPADTCSDFIARYPQTEISLDPGALRVELLVPTQALAPQLFAQDWSQHDSGGLAGIVNYDLSWMNARNLGGSQDTWVARTELGGNAGNWILRSNQLISKVDNRQSTQVLDAYAQRTFSAHASVLQLGQIDLANPALASMAVHGVQVFPEQSLPRRSRGRSVEGVAQGQARVDIRQGGRLVHSTVVPGGPFSITLPANLDAFAALQVITTEADGEQDTREVPALPQLALGAADGVSFGLGVVRDAYRQPWIVSGGMVGTLHERMTLAGGAVATDGYQSVGFGLGQALWPGAQLQGALRQADARHLQVRGSQGLVRVSQQLTDAWSASVGAGRQSSGFRQLYEAVENPARTRDVARERGHYSLGLSWNHRLLGGLHGSLSQVQLSDGQRSGSAGLGWSKSFERLTVSASLNWLDSIQAGPRRSMLLSVSVPLGGARRLRFSSQEHGDNRRLGVSLQEAVSDTFGYRLGVQQSNRDDLLGSQAGMTLMSRFNQLQLDHADNGDGSRQLSANVRGGAVVHDQGMTLSPYPLQDTFALLEVGKLPKVKVQTPSGPVWTDRQGRAVAAQVRAYTPNTLQVETRSLPRSAELGNAVARVLASRGAVSRLSFDVVHRRRLLLHAARDGQPLPAGASVVDGNGTLVTLVQAQGMIFLHDVQPDTALQVTGIDQTPCVLDFQIPPVADESLYYEVVPAACQSV